jgi:hypothetical protein
MVARSAFETECRDATALDDAALADLAQHFRGELIRPGDPQLLGAPRRWQLRYDRVAAFGLNSRIVDDPASNSGFPRGSRGNLHGSMPDALVAVDEWVALNQRQTQRRGLLSESDIQIATAERGLGLGNCGLQGTEVPDAGRASCRLQEAPMQFDNLPQLT